MDIETLGIPKAKVNQFRKKGMETIEQLAMNFPRKYYDFRKITPIREVEHGDIVAIIGEVQEIKTFEKMIQVKVKDDSGRHLFVSWFHQAYVVKLLKVGTPYFFCGKVQIDPEYGTKRMGNPFYFSSDLNKYRKIIPVYSKIAGMSDEYLTNSIESAVALLNKQDFLEPEILSKFGLLKRSQAFQGIHQPTNDKELEQAKYRFLFEDLFEFAMQLEASQDNNNQKSPFQMTKYKEIRSFLASLPFNLTDGQREALRTLSVKMKIGERVHALIQGDVGCGKTIVAIILMMVASENGYQSAMMAPTNVLAKQHYEELVAKTKGTAYQVAFLSGDMKAKEKKKVLKQIKDGEVQMVVGTHAILSKDVEFHKLSLTIVDEEHRFGVIQRNQLREKAKQGVHHISMSATPIPRSLALAMHGDHVDVLTIKTLPRGRKPVQTVLVRNEEKVYEGMYREIQKGRQCYVVCPLIEDSDAEVLQDVDSVEATYEKMVRYFSKHPEVNIAMISGKMKQEEINEMIQAYSQNKYQILISTTIIEVGVNVPNATVMAIKNAERFGLAQLHQLRGRVGRGSHESYCVLLSDKIDDPKLKAMCETNDGFKIAEKDLALRGTGDLIGTKQTGQNKYVLLMLAYPQLYEKIKKEVKDIYQNQKRLSHYRFLDILDYSEESA